MLKEPDQFQLAETALTDQFPFKRRQTRVDNMIVEWLVLEAIDGQ